MALEVDAGYGQVLKRLMEEQVEQHAYDEGSAH